MTKEEIIRELSDQITVTYIGRSQWRISSHIVADNNEVLCLYAKSHNEEDKTGIFDGQKYNKFLGLRNKAEIKKEFGLRNWDEVNEFLSKHWMDSACEDNYEPVGERDLRLAERLYDANTETIEEFLSANNKQ